MSGGSGYFQPISGFCTLSVNSRSVTFLLTHWRQTSKYHPMDILPFGRLAALLVMLVSSGAPAQSEATSLVETRNAALVLSFFTPPLDHDVPTLTPLRVQGRYSWLIAPAIAQRWASKQI